ncbi:MAG: ABC transporter permease subunit [Anaerolineae bacterium]|nr:ABC transporter permease subunit [Anaerolineae bacterium]
MRLRRVYWIVLRKELRELLRDRRSLFWLFAPPIILPGLAICAGLFIGSQALRIASEGFPVWVENGDLAPELVAEFEADDVTYLVDPPPNPAADPFGDALILIQISDDFQEQLASGEPASLRLLTKDNALITMFGQGAVRAVIGAYEQQLVDARLEAEGFDRAWLSPLEVREDKARDTGTAVSRVTGDEEDDGPGFLATIFLPLAVTSWLIGGGMGLILDTTVGEKERQTIENLLVTPASRVGIVLGKLTVVFIASVAVMSLWLAEGVVLNALSAAGPELMNAEQLSPTATLDVVLNSGGNMVVLVGVLVVVIIPFIVQLNGLVMAWCARAANYREANLFMVLMQLGLPASILLTIFSVPAQVGLPIYALPFFGTIVAIRDLFSSTLSTPGLLMNVGSGMLYAVVSISLAAWVFNKEWSVTRGLQ